MRAFVLLLTAACSIDESGLAPTGGDAGSAETGRDVMVADAPSSCTDASACTSTLPAGWTPVAFAATQTTTCPSGFTTTDVVASPSAQTGACSCDCNVTKAPSCEVGNLTGKFGHDTSCGDGTNGPLPITSDGECYSWGSVSLVSYHEWNPLPLTPGTCSSNATPNKAMVTSTPMRVCAPPPQCADDVCAGTPPSGFHSCIGHTGALACPSGPFTQSYTVGSDVTLSCGTCSACTATGTGCTGAQVSYFTDAKCTTLTASNTADGTCNMNGGGIIGYFQYTATVQNPTCNAGASAPTVDLAMKQTVCCRP